jgi:hypothetical protein
MYAAIQDMDDKQVLHAALHVLKAKIMRLHKGPDQFYFLGATEWERQGEEQPTLFHLIRKWKRQKHHHVESMMGRGTYVPQLQIGSEFLWRIYGRSLQ